MASPSLRVGIVGVAGKMGQTLVQTVLETPGVGLSAASEMAGHPALGQDVGGVCGASEPLGVSVSPDINAVVGDADVVIDFTRPLGTLATLEAATAQSVPVVIGTTGFTPSQTQRIQQAAQQIPVMFAANYSVGVTVLLNLLERAARALGDDFDIEVVEAHHRHKVDAPSGTALAMGQALARGRGIDLDNAVFTRHGDTGARKRGVIGFQTLRGGDVVGEHNALFLGDGERLEIGHRASSRFNFSKGAVRAAQWLQAQPPGLYDMRDVLREALDV
ncbi:MAG: 4-hydroxy-tetrahydrodipicolinate reductase [Pseudomonadota bacterium]